MPFYYKFSAAVQKLGLEFDRTESAQLPNGNKVGYSVSGTDYSLFYGGAFNGVTTVGPVDIDMGLSRLTRGSNTLLNVRFFVGKGMWVNDSFEARAVAGLHILDYDSDSHITRATLGFSLEVLCPINDWVAVTMAYSPSISGDQMLSIGVGLFISRYLPKDRISRDGIETALAQATQTLNEIKVSLSADTINEVARQYKEPAQLALRHISALGNVVNYLVYPKYPWVNPNGLGFLEWVAKAKGEVEFAKSLGVQPWDQRVVSKLEQEIDNLPSQIALTLATDFASDKYDILKTLHKMKGQAQQSLVAGYIGDYRFTVKNLENIITDPTVKKKIQSIVSPVLAKLDGLEKTLPTGVTPL